MATKANVVWSWDITKLRGPDRGLYYDLYVILDIYSRYVVGWTLAAAESGELAKDLITDCLTRQQITPGTLSLHADRGTSMTSKPISYFCNGVKNLFPRRPARSTPRPSWSMINSFSYGRRPTRCCLISRSSCIANSGANHRRVSPGLTASALIVQGGKDTSVPDAITNQLVKQLRSMHDTVTYRTYPAQTDEQVTQAAQLAINALGLRPSSTVTPGCRASH